MPYLRYGDVFGVCPDSKADGRSENGITRLETGDIDLNMESFAFYSDIWRRCVWHRLHRIDANY